MTIVADPAPAAVVESLSKGELLVRVTCKPPAGAATGRIRLTAPDWRNWPMVKPSATIRFPAPWTRMPTDPEPYPAGLAVIWAVPKPTAWNPVTAVSEPAPIVRSEE